jgi:hypothetical protein
MIAGISVSMVQDGKELLTVGQGDITLGERTATFSLSVEQTLLFKPGIAELQLTVYDVLGEVLVSDVRSVAVRKKLPEDA